MLILDAEIRDLLSSDTSEDDQEQSSQVQKRDLGEVMSACEDIALLISETGEK
jgi:hypothetical protein